jgi:hypothetical protein
LLIISKIIFIFLVKNILLYLPSNKIRLGSETNSTPIHTLFLSPPDIPLTRFPPTKVSLHFYSYNFLITFSTFYNFSEVDPFSLKKAENLKDSN